MRLSSTPAYHSWRTAKARCHTKTFSQYHRYGAKGVTMCERWRASFAEFLKDMGPRPPGTTLDRIDPKGHYEPGNCRWADRFEQQNNKTNNFRYKFNGLEMTQSQWARHLGMAERTLHMRFASGWSIERALTTPLRQRKDQGKPQYQENVR